MIDGLAVVSWRLHYLDGTDVCGVALHEHEHVGADKGKRIRVRYEMPSCAAE